MHAWGMSQNGLVFCYTGAPHDPREITALKTVSHLWRAGGVLALAFGLGACAGVSEKSVSQNTAIVSAPTKEVSTADFVKRDTYCPPLQVRAGTSPIEVYERGHEKEQAYVRYLASISQTARECTMSGDTLTIKVGVAGRVVAGPKGSAGNNTQPERIAVTKQLGGDGPIYSELFKIPVTLSAPSFGANYNQVFDQVVVQAPPADRNLIIFVGFDEGPGK